VRECGERVFGTGLFLVRTWRKRVRDATIRTYDSRVFRADKPKRSLCGAFRTYAEIVISPD